MKIQGYWIDIFTFFKILNVQKDPDPIIIILGISKDIRKLKQHFLAYGIITTKKLFILETMTTMNLWLTKLMGTLHLKIIQFLINDKLKYFEKILQALDSSCRKNLN